MEQGNSPGNRRFGILDVIWVLVLNALGYAISILPIGMSNDSGAHAWVATIGYGLLLVAIPASIICMIVSLKRQSGTLLLIAKLIPFIPLLVTFVLFAIATA